MCAAKQFIETVFVRLLLLVALTLSVVTFCLSFCELKQKFKNCKVFQLDYSSEVNIFSILYFELPVTRAVTAASQKLIKEFKSFISLDSVQLRNCLDNTNTVLPLYYHWTRRKPLYHYFKRIGEEVK